MTRGELDARSRMIGRLDTVGQATFGAVYAACLLAGMWRPQSGEWTSELMLYAAQDIVWC